MGSALLTGVITNYLTIFLGALAGFSLLILRCKRILRFYGVRRSRRGLRIIITRLEVKPGGTVAVLPINNGYVGAAVPQPEYEAAVLLQEQIRPSAFSWVSREIRDWLSGKPVLAAAVNPIIELAPAPAVGSSWQQAPARENLILIGGPAYNAVAGYYQSLKNAHFKFDRQSSGADWYVRPMRGRAPEDKGVFQSRSAGQELAFIQRITVKETGAYVTMCCGTGAGATLAAAEYLSRHYRQLGRRCRNGEYRIVLAYPGVSDPQCRFPSETKEMVLDHMVDGMRDH